MNSNTNPKVVLKLPRTTKGVLFFAQAVHAAMKGNPAFPAPQPPLSVLETDILALEEAEVACLSRLKGTTAVRDAKLGAVCRDLEQLASYVQAAARANPPQALALIESAGMTAKRPGMRSKPELAVKRGLVSGSVRLVARAVAKQASYGWEYSSDGVSWLDLEPTLQAETTVSGLVPGRRYAFRVRPLYRGGRGDPSQTVWELVL